MKTGFIAIVGLSNAGKSTLLNSLIQQKIAIVSPKPQTTRTNILGIWTDDDSQMVFVDTPGFLKSKNALGDYMLKSIDTATSDVDCILVAIDGHDGIDEREISQLKRYTKGKIPVVVAVTKIDITQKEKLLAELSKLNNIENLAEVFCVSARRNNGVNELKQALKKYLTSHQMYFANDDITDKSQRFLVAEIIREKILLLVEEEIPHGVGIEINKMTFDQSQNLWDVDANIILEKQTHKPIILGKNGSMIKQIGQYSRESMQKMLDARVYLALWVKIKQDWRNNDFMLNQLGYNSTSGEK